MQLILPDGESADSDRNVEELIDVCIEHPHVRSVDLQVREIVQRLLSTKLKLLLARELRSVYWEEGLHGPPLCASCPRCSTVAADWTFWVSLEPCSASSQRRGGQDVCWRSQFHPGLRPGSRAGDHRDPASPSVRAGTTPAHES